jgi:hypothetical protein
MSKDYIGRLTYTVDDEIRTGQKLQDVESSIEFHGFRQYNSTGTGKKYRHIYPIYWLNRRCRT